MAFNQIFENIVEEKLLSLHTCYIGRVLSFSGETATVQPLQMIKQYGKTAVNSSIIPNVPVAKNARYKVIEKKVNADSETNDGSILSVTTDGNTLIIDSTFDKVPLATGDLVVCVCGERNISEARKGNIAQPALGHHSMSDSIIIGVL